MKKLVTLLLSAVFVLVGTGIATTMNVAPVAEIKVVGISPLEAEVEGRTFESTGLSVVGNGEIVLLMGMEAAGEEVTTYAWSLTAPNGSSAALESTTSAETMFRPDVVGQYEVTLDITTATGTSQASVVITSANYVGVGSIGGATPNTAAGQCGTCHSGNTAGWAATNHATFFTRAIDGQASSHYNEGCIGCHTLGFNTDPEADNGGFDDVAAATGWTFPETLQDGNWQDILDNYPQLAQVSNIQCENCHGPGSQHFGNKQKIALSLDEAVCGKCHEDGHYHIKNSQWKLSGHSVGIASAAGRSNCARCHSGWGFIAEVDPASDLDMTTGSPQVSCAVCHDPHSTQYADQLRRVENVTLLNGTVVAWGGNGRLCMNCHMGRRDAVEYAVPANASSHFGPHYSNQTDMLAGDNVITFGRYIGGSTHWDALEGACVDCHMYSPKEGEPGFEAIPTGHAEDRMSPMGEHSWAMHAVVDGEAIDNAGACRRCHGEELTSFDEIVPRGDADGDGDADESYGEEIEGLLHDIAMMLPPLGEPEVDTRLGYSPLQMKAAFNWLFVEEDGSHGAHNYRFSVNLLQLTKQVLMYGVLTEGFIESIADVPNDQGKQVMVQWARFGGDGPSDDPVQTYYVWRRVDEMAKAPFQGRTYGSFADVPVDAEEVVNARVMADGHVWSAVGSQPAAQLESYAAVVPTLADSTADGAVWSVFMVSGHAENSQIYVTTAPDSAYSIDNLAPMAPSSVAATSDGVSVMLAWEAAMEEDFKYYEVIRSDQPGFDIESAEVVGTSTEPDFVDSNVENGRTYYYRVAAYDFAGNRGAFSEEVSTIVMVALEGEGIPTEFALKQNYPNPFNPSTRITFSVPEASHVRITVVDVSGKQVAVLLDANRSAGTYNLTWDAGSLASGTYIYRMEAGKFVHARTMTLLR